MICSSLIIIEGESRSPDDLIEAIGKKKRTRKVRDEEEEDGEKILQVGVYLPCVRTVNHLIKLYANNKSNA